MKEIKFALKLLNNTPLKETFYAVARYNRFGHKGKGADNIVVNTPLYALVIHLNNNTFEVIELNK